jgi:hypothetical protein
MDKQHIVKFLKANKRGIYNVIVQLYSDVVLSMGAAMSLEVIKEDLEKETGEKIELKYFSLAQAIARFKSDPSRAKEQTKKKWEFKDTNESKKDQVIPGKFKLDQ